VLTAALSLGRLASCRVRGLACPVVVDASQIMPTNYRWQALVTVGLMMSANYWAKRLR